MSELINDIGFCIRWLKSDMKNIERIIRSLEKAKDIIGETRYECGLSDYLSLIAAKLDLPFDIIDSCASELWESKENIGAFIFNLKAFEEASESEWQEMIELDRKIKEERKAQKGE